MTSRKGVKDFVTEVLKLKYWKAWQGGMGCHKIVWRHLQTTPKFCFNLYVILENDDFDFHVEFSMKFWGRCRQSDRFANDPDVMNDLGGFVVDNVAAIVNPTIATTRDYSIHAILENKTFQWRVL